jgi:hypothetical protein
MTRLSTLPRPFGLANRRTDASIGPDMAGKRPSEALG